MISLIKNRIGQRREKAYEELLNVQAEKGTYLCKFMLYGAISALSSESFNDFNIENLFILLFVLL